MRTSLRTNFLASFLGLVRRDLVAGYIGIIYKRSVLCSQRLKCNGDLEGGGNTFNLLLRSLWVTTGPIQIVTANTSGSKSSVETGSVRHCYGWIVVAVMGFEFKVAL